VDLSLRNLATLQAQGHRFDFRVFLGQGHNNLAATFDAAIHWINDFARRSETESVPTDSIRRDASS
jgi:hypothetical protein